MTGWSEKVLDIDLSTHTYRTYPLDMEMARLFIGGRGLGARLLWGMVGPDVDPLSPENVLIFTNGPLTGTGYQTSNRFSVTTKSPLTGTVLDIKNGEIRFHEARELWGMRVFALTEKLGQNNNKRNVLCIGPAGENLSRIASIMNDRERALARGGTGAVMGSKKSWRGRSVPTSKTRSDSNSCSTKRANCWQQVRSPARHCPSLAPSS
jgi:aldehyde:ferredoxin oxidoreductase